MNRRSTIFLQIVIVLIGFGALALLLWEPHLEGRNASATNYEIYFHDPFLVYAYTASIAFFVALYQAYALLGFIAQNQVFSAKSVQALRKIKYCALLLVGFVAAPITYLFIVQPGDDIAGGVAIGLVLMFLSSVVATAAAVFEKTLQSAVDLKAENDLTV